MASISVDHSKLREAAKAVSSYCKEQDRQMRTADNAVKIGVPTAWKGSDARVFVQKWEDVDTRDSVVYKCRQIAENYSKALTSCADLYQKAQADSYNEAASLPKWFA